MKKQLELRNLCAPFGYNRPFIERLNADFEVSDLSDFVQGFEKLALGSHER